MVDKAVAGFFAIFLTVYFLEAIGGFYMTSALVSIEKQFEIPSQMSGLMVSAGDFGYIPSVVFVSYFGSKGNRARWIGVGCIMIAFANILISSSNFLFPVQNAHLNSSFIETTLLEDSDRLDDHLQIGTFLNYVRNRSTSDSTEFQELVSHSNRLNLEEISKIRQLAWLPFAFCNTVLNACRRRIEMIRCSKNSSNLGPFIMIFGGLLILGIGRTMPYSLGLPLVDDNVKRQNLPIYFAGMFFIRILGPALGFLIGSITNKYFYNFNVPSGLTPRDPMWIGCWWAGFLGIGIAMLGPSLVLYLYPTCINYKNGNLLQRDDIRSNNGMLVLDEETASEMQPLANEKSRTIGKRSGLALFDRHVTKDETGRTVVPITAKAKVADFISTIGTVLKTPVYVASIIGRILDVLAFKGFTVFLPKYLEIQFGLPQYKVSLYMGMFGVAGLAIGAMVGSAMMRKFKFQGRKAAVYVAVCSFIAVMPSFINATIRCQSTTGLLAQKLRMTNGNFTTLCNAGCHCDGMPFYPVCNRNGETFYSPCHAGCPLDQFQDSISSDKNFNNCKCSNSMDRVVSRRFCDQSVCETKFKWYFANIAISGFFGGMSVIPAMLILLRSVPPMDRSVSLGFQGFLVSLLATLPSPVFWGWIIDKSCVLWNTACYKKSRGACALFDSDKLRLTIHITYGMMRLLSTVTDIMVCYFAKNLILTDEEESNEIVNVRKRSHFLSS